jgi:DNA-binding GntR family transcriptional regulator
MKANGPVTVTDYVTRSIRERILSGTYPPGSKLDQRMLVEEFGASLIPVRESLRQLAAQGFVCLYPHKGAYVAELSLAEVKEIYFVRELLEAAAARLAVPRLSVEDKERLAHNLAQMKSATAAGDYARLLEVNRDFHFVIYEASGNQLLVEMIRGLWDRSSRYRHLYTYLPDRAPRALAEHKRIYRLCLAGDAEAAGRAVGSNVRQTVRGLIPVLRARLVKADAAQLS